MNVLLRRLSILFSVALALLLPEAVRADDEYVRHQIESPVPDGATLEGSVRFLRPNGSLEGSGGFVNGKLEGPWDAFLSDGQRAITVTFRAGAADGAVTIYYRTGDGAPSGTASLEGVVKLTVFEGEVVTWHPDGKKQSERLFENGRLKTARGWGKDGNELAPAAALELANKFTAADLKFIGRCVDVLQSVATRGKRVAPAK